MLWVILAPIFQLSPASGKILETRGIILGRVDDVQEPHPVRLSPGDELSAQPYLELVGKRASRAPMRKRDLLSAVCSMVRLRRLYRSLFFFGVFVLIRSGNIAFLSGDQ